jgi:protein-L-isoaspartate(D-aspartate) O-methyltransferase
MPSEQTQARGAVVSLSQCVMVLGTAWCAVLSIAIGLTQTASAADPYQRSRVLMVQQHIASAGIKNPGVLQSMRSTLRHEFMTPDQRHLAYFDMAVPIGHGQTISPPYIVAFMTAQLDPQPTDRVLEIGTGSGYQAAVVSPLVKDVYTIEIVEPLGTRAAQTLRRLGYQNVFTKIGDGYQGWPQRAPFDKIIVTCSPEDIPQPLVDQLAEGGLMIIPIGERFQQTLVRFKKVDGQLEREPLQATFFVPMTGESEELREVKPDLSKPAVANGSFEQTLDETMAPVGWYYLREGRSVEQSSAPDGQRVLSLENRIAGRNAHALQAFGVDGMVVKQIQLSMQIAGDRIRSGRQPFQTARAVVEFYGEDRAPVGQVTVGPWTGTFDWQSVSETFDVPPAARLAVVGVGLFGATGELMIDHVAVESR